MIFSKIRFCTIQTIIYPSPHSFIINRDYVENTSHINEIYKKVLYPIFDIKIDVNEDETYTVLKDDKNIAKVQNMEFNLNSLARTLAGHIEDKTWLLFVGERNSGKGVIQDGLISVFGDYIGTFNSENLISKPSIGEATKQNAWLCDLEFRRLVFGSELSIRLDNRGNHVNKLNGTLLKIIMSGGDKLTARTNGTQRPAII